ncbi:MAG: YdcF family protein [Verrucomicrobia bacterium]|nr:YdcF family protein [Verrucomicrobiota bacterium]MDA1005464.1 YdcF family protein [Verrucomicrobiota bacterium]
MRSPRWKRSLRIILGTFLALTLYLVYQAVSIHRFGFSDDGRSADCAIVLGAAAYHNKPSPVFTERINQGIRLYKEGRVAHLILTGGFGEGAPFAESEVALDHCLAHGVPREALLLETTSQTTDQNLVEAKRLMDENAWQTALVVSDPWHLKRAVAAAKDLGIEAHPSGTITTRYESPKARAGFLLRELYFYHRYLFLGR